MRNDDQHIALQHFGGWDALAAAVGVTRQALQYRAARWPHMLTAEDCVALEERTGGALTRDQLRPDLWPPQKQNTDPEPTQGLAE